MLDLHLEDLAREAELSGLNLLEIPIGLPAKEHIVASIADEYNVHLEWVIEEEELSVPFVSLL